MCHLGTHTHATVENTTGAAAERAQSWHPGSPHASWLVTSRDQGWRRGNAGALRTFATSLAALAHDCRNLS